MNPMEVHIKTSNHEFFKTLSKEVSNQSTENDLLHISKEVYQISLSINAFNKLSSKSENE